MNTFRVEIRVVPRRGILDPQGKAVADALHTLGFADVEDVRVGRHLVVRLRAADADAAREGARAMCERLLANPVTEDYEIEQVVAREAAAAHA
jgi:phosphoribosylformylglycinamidine synthase subunit PurS